MSHIVTLNVKINDKETLRQVAEEDLGLSVKLKETVTYFGGVKRTGMTVRLPGWNYPVMVMDDGELIYDNYNGRWGDQGQLNQLVQNYVIACVYKEAGHVPVASEITEDGTVKLRLPAMAFAQRGA
jgi:hypothetical protein